MQIESYRDRLETFERDLNLELFLWRSGQKERLELASVYSEHSDLFSKDRLQEIESEIQGVGGGFESRRRSLERIHLFLADQRLDSLLAPICEEIAQFESGKTLLWEGARVSTGQASAMLAMEPDAAKRRALGEKRIKAYEGLGDLALERVRRLRAEAVGIDAEDYLKFSERVSGVDYVALLNELDEAFRSVDDLYQGRFRSSFEMASGVSLEKGGAWDIPFWEGRHDHHDIFRRQDLVPAVQATIVEMGLAPERSSAITLDFESRPAKQARSFCAPIRVPDDVRVSLFPGSGAHRCSALLHEYGHALHFAWTSPALPAEQRIFGDGGVAEAYAFLLENVLYDAGWLGRVFSFTRSKGFLEFEAVRRGFMIRREMGRLRFAIELHGRQSFDDVSRFYAEIMARDTGLVHHPESWPCDAGDDFAPAVYLRGWMLEAMLCEHLRTRYGRAWRLDRSAARFLKEIWETGLLYNAGELCREIGMGALTPRALIDQLTEELKQ